MEMARLGKVFSGQTLLDVEVKALTQLDIPNFDIEPGIQCIVQILNSREQLG